MSVKSLQCETYCFGRMLLASTILVALAGVSISPLGDLVWGFDSLRDPGGWNCGLAGGTSINKFSVEEQQDRLTKSVWWFPVFFLCQAGTNKIFRCLMAGRVCGSRHLGFRFGAALPPRRITFLLGVLAFCCWES